MQDLLEMWNREGEGHLPGNSFSSQAFLEISAVSNLETRERKHASSFSLVFARFACRILPPPPPPPFLAVERVFAQREETSARD